MTSQMGFMLLCVSVEYFVLVDAEIVLLNIVFESLKGMWTMDSICLCCRTLISLTLERNVSFIVALSVVFHCLQSLHHIKSNENAILCLKLNSFYSVSWTLTFNNTVYCV